MARFRHWRPYEHARFCRAWYTFRDSARYQFQKPLLPFVDFSRGELLFLGLVALVTIRMITSSHDAEDSGNLPNICLGFVYATVPHNSWLTFVLGVPFERALRYHILFALLAVGTGFWHGARIVADSGWSLGEDDFFSGVLLLGGMSLLVLLSQWPLRRRLFELFYRLHWLLFIACAFCGMAHGSTGAALGGLLWLLDVVYRYPFFCACAPSSRRLPSAARLTALPAGVVRVSFPRRNLAYRAGQYVFLCVPELSPVEWHPFSLSSAPHEAHASLHIRALGNWTRKLYALANKQNVPSTHRVLMEGPYGEPSVALDGSRYTCFLLISGGIGVTPMQSICNHLIEQEQRGRHIDKLWFVWSCRDKYLVGSVFHRHFTAPLPLLQSSAEEESDGTLSPTAAAAAASAAATSMPFSFSPNLLARTSQSIPAFSTDASAAAAAASSSSTAHLPVDSLSTVGDVAMATLVSPPPALATATNVPETKTSTVAAVGACGGGIEMDTVPSATASAVPPAIASAPGESAAAGGSAGTPTPAAASTADSTTAAPAAAAAALPIVLERGAVIEADYLHTEFYLTRARSSDDFEGGNVRPEAQPFLRMGRPNLPRIFQQMGRIATEKGADKVAVLCCGPSAMVAQARRLSWEHSTAGLSFDFHSETFAF